jgi:hypothetical protein
MNHLPNYQQLMQIFSTENSMCAQIVVHFFFFFKNNLAGSLTITTSTALWTSQVCQG